MAGQYPFKCDNWVSAQNLPDIPSVISSAQALLDSTGSWKPGKSYHAGKVRTLSKRDKGGKDKGWYVRVSEHGKDTDGAGFEDLWWALGVDHSVHESEFVPSLNVATPLSKFEEGEAWSLYYKFPPPVSPRSFTVLVIVARPSPTEGLIISLPYAPSAAEEKQLRKSVRGKYVSIERIRVLPSPSEGAGAGGGGKERVEWRMATQSDAAGAIPGWVQEASIASKIAEDVPFVLKWLKTHPAPSSSEPGHAGPSTNGGAPALEPIKHAEPLRMDTDTGDVPPELAPIPDTAPGEVPPELAPIPDVQMAVK